jgi:hypothetical protein
VQQQSPPPAEGAPAHRDDADAAREDALEPPVSPQQVLKTSQDDKQRGEAATPELAVVRHYPLHKLGRLLAGRQAASLAAHQRSQRSSAHSAAAAAAATGTRSGQGSTASLREAEQDKAAAQALEHLLDGCKVCCMQFAPGGQLLVGLGSGHVCCLKLKHAAKSVWG